MSTGTVTLDDLRRYMNGLTGQSDGAYGGVADAQTERAGTISSQQRRHYRESVVNKRTTSRWRNKAMLPLTWPRD